MAARDRSRRSTLETSATKRSPRLVGSSTSCSVASGGYDVALVGWDPDWLVDVRELEVDYVGDGSIFDFNGLVLANHLVAQWNVGTAFVTFGPEHQWLPYQGASNAWR